MKLFAPPPYPRFQCWRPPRFSKSAYSPTLREGTRGWGVLWVSSFRPSTVRYLVCVLAPPQQHGRPGRPGQPGRSGLARPASPARPATPAPAGPRRACSTDGQERSRTVKTRSRHGQDTVKINTDLLQIFNPNDQKGRLQTLLPSN